MQLFSLIGMLITKILTKIHQTCASIISKILTVVTIFFSVHSGICNLHAYTSKINNIKRSFGILNLNFKSLYLQLYLEAGK